MKKEQEYNFGGQDFSGFREVLKKELSTSMYKISFTEFVSAHALRDLDRTASGTADAGV